MRKKEKEERKIGKKKADIAILRANKLDFKMKMGYKRQRWLFDHDKGDSTLRRHDTY